MLKSKSFLFLFFAIIVFSVLAIISIWPGHKGNDQHWYLAATESIIQNLEARSNNIFPRTALMGEVTKNPFIHNIPVVYLASIPSFILGGHLGWFFFNIVMAIITCILFFKLLNVHFSRDLSALFTSLLILFPLFLMFSTQALSEGFKMVLIISAVFLYYKRNLNNNFHLTNIAIVLIFSLLSISRSNFILLFFAIPFLLYPGFKFKKCIAITIGYLLVFAVSYSLLSAIFPSQLPSGIDGFKMTLLYYTPENTAPMHGFWGNEEDPLAGLNFKEQIISFTNIMWLKTIKGLKLQFLATDPPSLFSFGIFNGLFIISTIGAILKRKKEETLKFYFVSLILFTIQLATSIVFNNSIRYLSPYFPVILLNTILIFKKELKNIYLNHKIWFRTTFIMISFAFILVSIYVIRNYFNEAKEQKALRAHISSQVSDFIPANETIWTERQNAIISYTLFPRDFLNAGPNYYTDSELITMIENTKANWFFSWNNPEIIMNRLYKFGYCFTYVTDFTFEGRNVLVYKLNRTN